MIFNWVWLIPALPLFGFLFNAFLGKRVGKTVVGWLASLVVLSGFAISVAVLAALLKLPESERHRIVGLFPGGAVVPWIHIGRFQMNYAALVDPLSLLMCLIVTGVGGLIHVYATGYMAEDQDYSRFFTYFNLFIFFMLTLVLAENMLLLFVGWEGVGLCSYLLIAFWYEDKNNALAGNKAFIVNRIGDVGFALGMMLIFATFGTLSFYGNAAHPGFLQMAAKHITAHGPLLMSTATVIGILLFIGACGKSAQFPLYVWLPDAMAGPTPVSALIHAATMVTAGVVMVSRCSPLITDSVTVMIVIAGIGCFTAFLAASIGLVQNDIKKVLAYSTVSQLGYMFMGCGVGAFSAGMFHVMTHAFFKGLLFLGAGSVIHALGGEQDMRRMGGLKNRIPITHWTMAAAWFAIAGFPLFSGFWSKDEILGAAYAAPDAGKALWFVGVVTALMTAFYMSRLMWKTFYTNQRFNESELGHGGHGGHGHTGVHESPPSMTVPLIILGVLSVVGGFIGSPLMGDAFQHYLAPAVRNTTTLPEGFTGSTLVLMVISSLVAVGGILLAMALYAKRRETGDLIPVAAKAKMGPASPYQFLLNLWYWDALCNKVAIGYGGVFGNILKWIDTYIVDGLVNASAWIVGSLASGFRRTQTGFVRNYALTMLIGVVAVMAGMLWGSFHFIGK